jgi:hypothetical protein
MSPVVLILLVLVLLFLFGGWHGGRSKGDRRGNYYGYGRGGYFGGGLGLILVVLLVLWLAHLI